MPARGRFTDSAGITVDYTPIERIAKGAAVAEGGRPFLVVDRVEIQEDAARMHFSGGHIGGWVPLGSLVPVEIESPSGESHG